MTGVSLKDVSELDWSGCYSNEYSFDLGLYNLNAQGTLESSPTYHTIVINPTLGDADNMFGRYVETKGYYDWEIYRIQLKLNFTILKIRKLHHPISTIKLRKAGSQSYYLTSPQSSLIQRILNLFQA